MTRFTALRRALSTLGAAPPCAGRPTLPALSSFPFSLPLDLRWEDNDAYGHVNNVRYYSFFDTCVNRMLLQRGLLSLPPAPGAPIGLVAASACTFHAPLAFPGAATVALRVERLGTSSVTYALAVFGGGGGCAASGSYTHVYVDASTRRPLPALPARMREALAQLA